MVTPRVGAAGAFAEGVGEHGPKPGIALGGVFVGGEDADHRRFEFVRHAGELSDVADLDFAVRHVGVFEVG